jgi:hypothetical protein
MAGTTGYLEDRYSHYQDGLYSYRLIDQFSDQFSDQSSDRPGNRAQTASPDSLKLNSTLSRSGEMHILDDPHTAYNVYYVK